MKSWAIYAVVIIGFMGYKFATDADRDGSGEIVNAGNLDVFDLKVGDCFDDTSLESVSTLPAKPCSEPHDNEAYAAFNVSIDSFPGDEEMHSIAFDSCLERFESWVGIGYDSSELDILTLYPSAESWAQADREVICSVYDMNANKLTGSMRGSGV